MSGVYLAQRYRFPEGQRYETCLNSIPIPVPSSVPKGTDTVPTGQFGGVSGGTIRGI